MKFTLLPLCLLLFLINGCSKDAKPTKEWSLVADGITAAALNESHALLATIDQGGQWWQLQPKRLLHTFRHGSTQQQDLVSVAVTPDGQFALTADREGIAWWHTPGGKPLASWSLPGIQTVKLSTDGQWALIGLTDRAVYFYLKSGKTRFAFPHERNVKTVSLDRKGRFALTGGDDGQAKLWDLTSGTLVHHWNHRGKLANVTLSPRGTYAVTNALLGPIRIWDTRSGKLKHELNPDFITVTSAAFSNKEGYLATGHPSQGIKLWSVRKGRLLREFKTRRSLWRPNASPVLALEFSPRIRYLLSATSDGRVQKWRMKGKNK